MIPEHLREAAPHDILQAWHEGEIGYRDAMELTASGNLFELYEMCRSSGIELRKGTVAA